MGRSQEKQEAQGIQRGCNCPFCDSSMDMPYPFCQVCGCEIEYCAVCGEPLSAGAESCPHCAEGGQ